MNVARYALQGIALISALASYDCRRRNRDGDDNSNNNRPTPTQPAPQPTAPQPTAPQPTAPQPGVPQPGMQPGMQQPGVPQPGMPQPGMPQPGMPQPGAPDPNAQPGTPQPADPSQQGGDFIASQMTMRQQQFAQGMAPVLPLTRGTLAQGGTQNYAVQMTPGQCYKIIGVGGEGVVDLDLKLYDPSNQLVDQDVATDNFPVIGLSRQLCPQAAGQYRLEVLMYSGTGPYGVQVFGR